MSLYYIIIYIFSLARRGYSVLIEGYLGHHYSKESLDRMAGDMAGSVSKLNIWSRDNESENTILTTLGILNK